MLRSLVPYSMWFIDFPVQTHTHARWRWAQIPHWFMERGRGGGGENCDVWMGVLVWVIRVCFSALSLNSPLAHCWKGWYWILADMFPQVWEQEMRAHAVLSALILLTRIFLLLGGEKENWRENVKVRQGERGVDKNEDGQNGEKRESKCKKMIIKFHVSVELEFPSQISYRPFGKHETYSEPNDCRGKSST